MMNEFVCERCDKHFFDEELPRRGAICFACHVKSINIGFAHGKENFHGDTIKQRQDEQVRVAKEAGITAEPVGQRWV